MSSNFLEKFLNKIRHKKQRLLIKGARKKNKALNVLKSEKNVTHSDFYTSSFNRSRDNRGGGANMPSPRVRIRGTSFWIN